MNPERHRACHVCYLLDGLPFDRKFLSRECVKILKQFFSKTASQPMVIFERLMKIIEGGLHNGVGTASTQSLIPKTKN